MSTVLIGSAAATCSASLLIDYQRVLPGPTRADGIVRPTAITVDRTSGEICVTDEGSHALHVYNGANAHVFHTGRVAGISVPAGGSLDASGGFVYTDAAAGSGRTIKRLNYVGEPLPYDPVSPSPDWSPGHLLVTAQGDFVTIDRRSGLLAKHDARTGDLLWTTDLGEYIPDDAGLAGRPAEAPDGRLYVPGAGARGVLVLSARGEFVSAFGKTGAARGAFVSPVGVAFGPQGTILVLDRMRHTILVFNADHEFVTEFGTFGDGPGRFYHPVAIAAAPDGQVYVAQGYRGRVQVFRMVEAETLPDRQGGGAS